MPRYLAFRLLRALTIMAVALAAAAPAHASTQTQATPATATAPKTIQPRGYDPYYRIPVATPSPAAAAEPAASGPPAWAIAASIAVTLSILAATAAHVRMEARRPRRRRASHRSA